MDDKEFEAFVFVPPLAAFVKCSIRKEAFWIQKEELGLLERIGQ